MDFTSSWISLVFALASIGFLPIITLQCDLYRTFCLNSDKICTYFISWLNHDEIDHGAQCTTTQRVFGCQIVLNECSSKGRLWWFSVWLEIGDTPNWIHFLLECFPDVLHSAVHIDAILYKFCPVWFVVYISFSFWLLDHVIYLKLRNKQLFAKHCKWL